MASVDPIDISSSSDSDDSVFEAIDEYREESPVRGATSSVNTRVLPPWASSTNSNLTGHNGVSLRDHSSASSKRQIVHDEVSSKRSRTVEPSSSRMAPEIFITSQTNGFVKPSTSHAMNSFKRSLPSSLQPYTPRESQNSFMRSLPVSLQPSTSREQSYSHLVDNVGSSSQMFGKSAAFSHDRTGNRLLPQSLMPGRTNPFAGPFDHIVGVGEESAADERLVLQAAVQDLHQPKNEANLPEGLLSVSLLRHQKIALAWMLSKEKSSLCGGGILADDQGLGKTVSTIALMLMQKHLEAKSKLNESCSAEPQALNLDDDDDGVSLVDDTNHSQENEDIKILPSSDNNNNNQAKRFVASSVRPLAGTLIVSPASVLRQWARELDEKVADKAKLSILIYHGGNRTKSPTALAKYDAVLTTYAIVANEVPKQPLVDEDDDEQKDGERYGLSSAFSMDKKKPKKSKKGKKRDNDLSAFENGNSGGTLARVRWSRVVLDESQTIKNHRTQVARACCSLKAKMRWCLSGTPIQNSIEELYSYFRFLRYDPYDKYKTFGASIKGLISRDSVKGYKKLQVVLRNIMLRRTKGTFLDGEPIITLPPKEIHLRRAEFSTEERNFYNQLESDSRKQFKAYAAAGTVSQNYANILLLLLRLRQACDHPLLVKGFSSDPVGKDSSEMAKMLPRDMIINLIKLLETSQAICLVCRDPPENAVVTMCGHVFCYQCVSDYLTGEDNTCPAENCKEQLGADVVYSRATLQKCICSEGDDENDDLHVSSSSGGNSKVLRRDYISSKIRSALEIIQTHCVQRSALFDDGSQREKAIVFSQWTSMLDLVEMSLQNTGINYRRLDGTMSIAARDKAVKEFNLDLEVDVMLMSLKAGNLGLNMVSASRVILLDLWWNPTTEDQAIDRAHRIGQTRPVTVSRLTVKDTVEDRILALQEEKRKMVASAFGEDPSGGHAKGLTVEDLRFLFEASGSRH